MLDFVVGGGLVLVLLGWLRLGFELFGWFNVFGFGFGAGLGGLRGLVFGMGFGL